jgi:hypothetical protein
MTKTKRKIRRKPKPKPLGTIWEVPDALWEKILPILLEFWPKKPTGRRHADWRAALNGIIFRMRTKGRQKFLLLLRTYWPSDAILDRQYQPPPVVRTGVRPTPLTRAARLRLRTPFIPRRLGNLVVPN